MSVGTTTSTTCKVSNTITLPVTNTGLAQVGWDGSIVAISAFNASATGTAQGYQQSLLLLPFASGKTLAKSGTSTIDLDQELNGVEMTLYDLIFAQPNNLFPVLSQAEMLGFNDPPTYPPVSVTGANSASCANALVFYQAITAFPTSTTAKAFTAVLNSANSNLTSSQGIDSAVNAFFAGTEGFQNVTFSSYVAVSTYLFAFANAFANFAATYTYYMYQSSGSTPSSGTNASAASAGKVVFTRTTTTVPQSLTDPNGGYSIVYTDASNKATNLTFSSGQLISSTGQDFPTIALQCSFTQLSQFTAQSSDAATVVPMLYGTAEGLSVIGIDAQNSASNPSVGQSIANFFNSQGMQIIGQIIGIVMGVKLLADGANWLRKRYTKDEQANKGKAPSEEQVAQDRAAKSSAENSLRAESQGVSNRLGANKSTIEEGLKVSSEESSEEIQLQRRAVKEEVLTDEESVNEGAAQLQTEAQVEVTSAMETDATALRTSMANLEKVDTTSSSAEASIEPIETNIATAEASLKTIGTEETASMSSQEKSALQESETAEASAAKVEQAEKTEEADEAKSGDEDELKDLAEDDL
jgi:hypothetical protein